MRHVKAEVKRQKAEVIVLVVLLAFAGVRKSSRELELRLENHGRPRAGAAIL